MKNPSKVVTMLTITSWPHMDTYFEYHRYSKASVRAKSVVFFFSMSLFPDNSANHLIQGVNLSSFYDQKAPCSAANLYIIAKQNLISNEMENQNVHLSLYNEEEEASFSLFNK